MNVSRNIFAVVDATIHGDEFIQGGFLLDAGIVQARIENDDGKRQDVAGICFDGGANQTKITNFCTSISLGDRSMGKQTPERARRRDISHSKSIGVCVYLDWRKCLG